MTSRDRCVAYGQLGLIIAAFVFVAGIIAAPILPKSGTSAVVASKSHYEPDLHLPITPASFKRDQLTRLLILRLRKVRPNTSIS
jgi:hypothetical protein